ncbi:short-chain dehydrogenase [Acaromyces ingoldii]|uniref:Short-chain dehydrogenase n=1 Tax=Acaromyces ingoldii TaxID=215250 RepID=A0A316YFD5_9BASI|nr:short-chain dehydrogenase [Acaromyces ingoldii]PWN86783.1 short-chain dehydrogenase [Acaromyces ingoldii]
MSFQRKSYAGSILITGGTSGLGFQAALEIAKACPECLVVLASRSNKDATEQINDSLKQTNTTFQSLNLSSLSSVRAFASAWEAENYPPLRCLILNAGLQFPGGLVKTDNGLEATFAINHVGHALLFYLLTPYFEKEARIIITSSGTHDPDQKTGMPNAKYSSAQELAYPSDDMVNIDGRQRYSSSKLANVLWTYALDRRLRMQKSARLTVNAFDPGLMPGTGLARAYGAMPRFIWSNVMPRLLPLLRLALGTNNIHTTANSGATLAWLATSEELDGKSGLYFEGRRAIRSSLASYDREKQDDLWSWTATHVAQTEEEEAKFRDLATL